MKYPVRRFTDLKTALNELEPFIRNGSHLQRGRPFKRFGGLRSREILVNWLLSVVGNFHSRSDRLSFTTDPTGGDGIIWDQVAEVAVLTEHVMVPKARSGDELDLGELILEKVRAKVSRGATYASGKTLVVFLNAGPGQWHPNQVARALPDPIHFDAAWVVALQGGDTERFIYQVTRLDLCQGNAPAWCVTIAADFGGWDVSVIQ